MGELIERKRAIDQKHLVIRDPERSLHKTFKLRGGGRFQFQPDDRAAPPSFEYRLKQAHQVFGFLLNLDFGIANNPESTLALYGVAWKQAPNEQAGRLFERDEASHARVSHLRKANVPFNLVRYTDQRIHRLAVTHAHQVERDRKAEIGDERKRMRRINRERGEHRINVAQEIILDPCFFLLRHIGAIDQHQIPSRLNALRSARPLLLLIARKLRDGFADARKLFARREAIGTFCRDPGADLALEAGNAHHEKFVEVIGRNREKAQPLEQRMAFIGQLLQYAAVEVQPGQLPIDKSAHARGKVISHGFQRQHLGHRRAWYFFFQNNDLAAIRHGRF